MILYTHIIMLDIRYKWKITMLNIVKCYRHMKLSFLLWRFSKRYEVIQDTVCAYELLADIIEILSRIESLDLSTLEKQVMIVDAASMSDLKIWLDEVVYGYDVIHDVTHRYINNYQQVRVSGWILRNTDSPTELMRELVNTLKRVEAMVNSNHDFFNKLSVRAKLYAPIKDLKIFIDALNRAKNHGVM